MVMFLIEQRFQGRDLSEGIDLIEPWADELDGLSTTGESVVVVVPERTRAVAVSLVWGGGIAATEALWDGELNEGLRCRRCLVPVSGVHLWRGSGAIVRSRNRSIFLAAGIIVRLSPSALEMCLTLGGRSAESLTSPLIPLAVSPRFARAWLSGSATDHLIKLLEGLPWSQPLSVQCEAALARPPI